jgi:hypothetical protein
MALARPQRVRADQDSAQAQAERVRAQRLAERLRTLGIDPDTD